ncbi:MAG: hypothetical protein IPL34_20145 [Thiofilum sp.]|uniref:hypothetical protein n=1 Tax=Thiofilum sp. TaxID=2212733 RepID=UPI0025E6C2D3|nr:hypothetical protein [Thiofilum sp.]MBK8455593.1 hypothetical protein [Thiofilum sp.]
MNKMIGFVSKTARKLLDLFPVKLPTGATAFSAFCSRILSTHGLPDMPSYHHAIASMVMNLSPQTDRKAPYFFVKAVRKAMANQTAYDAIQKIREEEKQKELAPGASTNEAIQE